MKNIFFKVVTLPCAMAVALVGGSVLFSCSGDDETGVEESDFSASQFETLASRRMTRSAEGSSPKIQYESNECGLWCILRLIGRSDDSEWYARAKEAVTSVGADLSDPNQGLTMPEMISICQELRTKYPGKLNAKQTAALNCNNFIEDPAKVQQELRERMQSGMLNGLTGLCMDPSGVPHYVIIVRSSDGLIVTRDVNSTADYNRRDYRISDFIGLIY